MQKYLRLKKMNTTNNYRGHSELENSVFIQDKKDFIRIVKNKDGEVNIDKTGKMPGRGAYLCDNIECLEKAIKTKRIEKTFEIKIEDEIYEKLRGVMVGK